MEFSDYTPPGHPPDVAALSRNAMALSGATAEAKLDDRLVLAQGLALKAEHYASAFRISARLCRVRVGDENTGQQLSDVFEQRAQLEDELARRLRETPIETLREEGLI